MEILLLIFGGLAGLLVILFGLLSIRFYRGGKRVDELLASAGIEKMKDLKPIHSLTVLPLIDWFPDNENLHGEAGVSYLVKVGEKRILFDVGFNPEGKHPSPLQQNMAALGVDVKSLTHIVISHAHVDHQGGMKATRSGSFALSTESQDLSHVEAFVPVPLTHDTAKVTVVDEPGKIIPELVTIGSIPRQLFFLGWTPEQSLAVDVEGKGIVLIVGCGHQGVERILERAEALFDQPIYGIIGGLHFPVTASRIVKLGIPFQRFLGTGHPPWSPLRKEDVENNIIALQQRNLKLVALSAHDSCDWSVEAFRKAFGPAFREVRVGDPIIV